MSLVITVWVPEGIILAADSRLSITYSTREPGLPIEYRHTITASDANDKIFLLKERFGLGTFGAAEIKGVPIAGFINRFIEEKVSGDVEIDQLPELLLEFFGGSRGWPPVSFYAVGFKSERGVSSPHVYVVNIAGKAFHRANTAELPVGANWGGDTEVMARLLSHVKVEQGQQWSEFPAASIPFTFFTLQDAIDFAVYAIRTTMESLRFQMRPKTVGGAIDILALKAGEKPMWVQRKRYSASA
jgi:hypothetical protein